MPVVKFFDLIVFIFFISSCATTGDLIQTRHKRTVEKKSPPVPSKEQAIQIETLHSDPVVPAQADGIKPTASGDFFVLKKNEPAQKENSTERYPVDAKKVGAILPLTGKYASVGQRALASIRLGLGLTEASPALSLVLYDSQGDPALAAAGVQKLLRDDNVIAIFGGLGAKEASAISNRADFFEVPFFAFSQKSGLTDNSEYTFRNAVTAEMQVDKLAEFAFQKLSLKKFAILYPNDLYGVEFANKFWDQVLARGGSVTAAQAYDPKSSDLSIYVKKMVGTYYVDDRASEYKQRLKDLKTKKYSSSVKKKSRENSAKENVLDPIVDFDAIFIPDSGRTLGQAIAFFKSSDVQNLTYLGTNLWNTPDLVRRAGSQNQNLFFIDTQVSATETTGSDFYKKYFSMSQQEPQLLEAQTYEAAQIIREQLSFGAPGRESLASNLRSLGRRLGAYGEIRMNNNKEIERDLTIFTVDHGAIRKY